MKQGKEGIGFVAYAVIGFVIVLFLAGIFVTLVPSTSPFYSSVNTITNSVNAVITLIFNPLILIPLAVVIVIVGAYALRELGRTGDAAGGHSR